LHIPYVAAASGDVICREKRAAMTDRAENRDG